MRGQRLSTFGGHGLLAYGGLRPRSLLCRHTSEPNNTGIRRHTAQIHFFSVYPATQHRQRIPLLGPQQNAATERKKRRWILRVNPILHHQPSNPKSKIGLLNIVQGGRCRRSLVLRKAPGSQNKCKCKTLPSVQIFHAKGCIKVPNAGINTT